MSPDPSNDHILIVVADKPAVGARLNIEGTDWLLIVMPEAERKAGNVVAYLVPTNEAVEAVRKGHLAWLSSNPNTKGIIYVFTHSTGIVGLP